MEFSQDDFDRLLMFEHARKTAEATYARDPLDADVSTLYSLHEPWFCLISCFSVVNSALLIKRIIFYLII